MQKVSILKPLCFDSKRDWLEYQALASITRGSAIHGFCEDCTPEYKAQMIEEGRCAFPRTTFALDREGALCGFRHSDERRPFATAIYRIRARNKRQAAREAQRAA